jgi:hypothetical protein
MTEIRAQRAIARTEVLENWSGIGSRPIPSRTQGHCQRCGFSEIRTDEVVDRELMYLAECPRCEHRWTSPEPILSASIRSEPAVTASLTVGFQRVPARAVREILPAA